MENKVFGAQSFTMLSTKSHKKIKKTLRNIGIEQKLNNFFKKSIEKLREKLWVTLWYKKYDWRKWDK